MKNFHSVGPVSLLNTSSASGLSVVKVLLINDHPLFKLGLRVLQLEVEQVVCHCVANTTSALEAAGPFDLILFGLDHADVGRLSGLDALNLAYPGTTVSVVSRDAGKALMDQALKASAACRVPRAAASDLLVQAMRLVLDGHQLMATRPATGAAAPSDPASPAESGPVSLDQLTDRQKEILVRVTQGHTNKAIARDLGIAEATVKSHVSSMFRTLKVTNRTAAVLQARKLGLMAMIGMPMPTRT